MISVASADAPNVKALVYVDAFAPDVGESCQSELASAPPAPADFAFSVPLPASEGTGDELHVNAKYFASTSPPPNRRMSRHVLPPPSGRSRSVLSRIKRRTLWDGRRSGPGSSLVMPTRSFHPTSMGKGHDAELLGAIHATDAGVAVMVIDYAAEAPPRNEIHDLREKRLTDIHAYLPER